MSKNNPHIILTDPNNRQFIFEIGFTKKVEQDKKLFYPTRPIYTQHNQVLVLFELDLENQSGSWVLRDRDVEDYLLHEHEIEFEIVYDHPLMESIFCRDDTNTLWSIEPTGFYASGESEEDDPPGLVITPRTFYQDDLVIERFFVHGDHHLYDVDDFRYRDGELLIYHDLKGDLNYLRIEEYAY